MDASTTKMEKANTAKSEQTNSDPYPMEPDASLPTARRFYFERLCTIVKISDDRKKTCEDIFLGLATVITLGATVLPTVLFIAINVHTTYMYIHITIPFNNSRSK